MSGTPSSVHRRGFFRPRTTPLEAQTDTFPADAHLVRARRPGMGSFFEVILSARVPAVLVLADQLLNLFDQLEDQLTIYREDSELSRINANAAQGPIPVESRLFDLLIQARAITRQTQGAFDVTSGPLSRVWGFVKGPRRVPDSATRAAARACCGIDGLDLDADRRTVAFRRAGMELNLGAIGKGYALDRAGELLGLWPFPLPIGALMHAGQSSALAIGSPPGSPGGRWSVSLRNPFDPARPLGTLWVRNRAVGTSGAVFQAFEEGGQKYGHIIDPRTGAPPISGPAQVTVLAPTAAEADAFSTAFYLLGPAASRPILDSSPHLAAIFVTEGPALLTFNLKPDDLDIDRSVVVPASLPIRKSPA
jgi:thiamine biosynthesis lipoprotein